MTSYVLVFLLGVITNQWLIIWVLAQLLEE
jgi:hypothetical protein